MQPGPPAKGPPYVIPEGTLLLAAHPGSGASQSFRVQHELARGGNGVVYLAASEGDGQQVVIKAPAWQEASPADLLIEERILSQLEHPNLVRLIGSARHGGVGPLLVLERLRPNPLLVLNRSEHRELLYRDPGSHYFPLPPGVALDLGFDLLRALDYMHTQGFVHHDVKLANLLVALEGHDPGELEELELLARQAKGEVRGVLTDLGGSRSIAYLRELSSGEGASEQVPPQLTPIYAPPEALLEISTPQGPRQQYLPSLDVYAAGIAIYALIAGRIPYDHLDADITQLDRILDLKRHERLGELEPIAREALEAIPLHDSEFRPGHRRTFFDDLEGFLRSCLDPRPQARPTARAARLRFQELFSFRNEGVWFRQGVFRLKRKMNRLIETRNALETGRRPQPKTDRAERRSPLQLAAAAVGAELGEQRVQAALEAVEDAAGLGVPLDLLQTLVRQGACSAERAASLRHLLDAEGLPVPPEVPPLKDAQEHFALRLLRADQVLSQEALDEAKVLRKQLAERGIPIRRVEILMARGQLARAPLDAVLEKLWGGAQATRRSARRGGAGRRGSRALQSSSSGLRLPRGARLSHLRLPVRDPEEARRFYAELLGWDDPGPGAPVLEDAAGVQIELVPSEQPQPQRLAFELLKPPAVRALWQRCRDQSLELEGQVEMGHGQLSFVVRDPDGHSLEVWASLGGT